MKTNWLWDSQRSLNEAKDILKNPDHELFDYYAELLFSRVNDPKEAFECMRKEDFLTHWSGIKRRMRKDAWLKTRVIFWQTMYDYLLKDFKKKGFEIRSPKKTPISEERALFGQMIKDLRKEKGWTQKQLADALESKQQFVSALERGYENPSMDTISRVAHALGRTVQLRLV